MPPIRFLHAAGLVSRRKEGLFVFYALADREVLLLCDIMCDRIERQADPDRLLGTA